MPGGLAWRYANCGATAIEAREADEFGVPVAEYTAARRIGVSHTEVLVVHLFGERYATARYAQTRRAGASHEQGCAAAGVPDAVGVPVGDILAAHWAGCDTVMYTHARQAGVSHSETLAAHRAGFNLVRFARSHEQGMRPGV